MNGDSIDEALVESLGAKQIYIYILYMRKVIGIPGWLMDGDRSVVICESN